MTLRSFVILTYMNMIIFVLIFIKDMKNNAIYMLE